MIGRNAQEKSGGTKKTTAIGGVRVGKTLKYPIGTEVAYLACDLDITEDKAWAKSKFPDTWQTHVVRGIVRYYDGGLEWGVMWEKHKRQERFKEPMMDKFVAFETDKPR